jgi:hypothetical protein
MNYLILFPKMVFSNDIGYDNLEDTVKNYYLLWLW